MNKLDFKNDLLTKQITKLTEDALKPMSIVEIKEKFNLSFPFQVKRVKDSFGQLPQPFPIGCVTTISAIFIDPLSKKGYVTNNESKIPSYSNQSADRQDYILHE